MPARGIHNGILFAVEKDVLSKSCSMLGGVLKDRKVSDKASNFKKNEVRSWILLFAKHVGDKAPNDSNGHRPPLSPSSSDMAGICG